MNKEEILKKLNDYIKDHDPFFRETTNLKKSTLDILEEDVLPVLKVNKNILENLYSWDYKKTNKGLAIKIKNYFKKIIKNIVINIIERVEIKQAKFNEITYNAIEILIKENRDLKKQIEELKINLSPNKNV